MPQCALPFLYEIEGGFSGLTMLAGLPLHLNLIAVYGSHSGDTRRSGPAARGSAGTGEPVRRHVQARTGAQEWTDAQILTALMVLHLAGGDCVDGLRTLEADEGFCLALPPVPPSRTHKRPGGPGRGGGRGPLEDQRDPTG